MIHEIYSSDSRFKRLTFKPGLNVLVTDKAHGAVKGGTRNAAGKSSFLEIVHYLLGSRSDKNSLFSKEVFSGVSFGMSFDLGSRKVKVERKAGPDAARGEIEIIGSSSSVADESIFNSLADGEQVIKIERWSEYLGKELFGIGNHSKYSPTFRMAFQYFCRIESAGGMSSPFLSWLKQPIWQRDVTLAFLLGLEWETLAKMEVLRAEHARLELLRKELKGSGVLGKAFGTAVSLRANLVIDDHKIALLEQQLKDFQVLPGYKDVELEASTLARRIAELADQNTSDRRLVADLNDAMLAEKVPGEADLQRLYNSIGIQFPGVVVARLDSVREFHRAVVRNRKAHLEGEISAAESRILGRTEESEKLCTRQRELMGILNAHGALDQFNKFNEELSRLRSNRDALRKQLDLAKSIEAGGAALDISRSTLKQSLLNDMEERSDQIGRLVRLYAGLSKEVSERSSVLVIEASSKGLHIDITGGPNKSKGIREQQIFCFDMLLAIIQSERANSLGVLIHDSHLFDAMDERQVANAIELGARLSAQYGFQYIITTNSDRVPHAEFSESFDFNSHVMRTHLSDQSDTGGLFGFRFS